jgi:hypothetical protein
MVWMLLSAACTAPPSEEDSVLPPAEESGGAEVILRPDPAWTAEEVDAQLSTLLTWGLPWPTTVLDAMPTLMAGSDGTCPQMNGANMESLMGCTSQAGWYYQGVSIYSEQPSGWVLMGDFYGVDLQGNRAVGGGMIGLQQQQQGNAAVQVAFFTGTWGYPPVQGWLGQTPSASLWIEQAEEGGQRQARIFGGYGIDGIYASFDQVTLSSERCGGAPQGSMSLRDPSGYWYQINFDPGCSGCGTLLWGEEELGQVCPDLAGALERLAP